MSPQYISMSRKGNVFDCAMEMLLLSIVEVSCSENGSQITAVNFKKLLPAISLTSVWKDSNQSLISFVDSLPLKTARPSSWYIPKKCIGSKSES